MDTELHYLTYSPEDIWQEMQQTYIENGGDILYQGDEKEMLLRGVQDMFMTAFAGVDNALRQSTLRYAVGEYLDIKGEEKGCYRLEAEPAKATVTIIARATGEAKTLIAGTAMTNDGSLFWELDEDLSLSGNVETVTVGITAATPGAAGNALTAGMEMGFVVQDDNEAVTSIVVATSASGGQNREDDETYRERIREYGLSTVTTGPYDQYERVTMGVSSEILDAAAVNGGAGKVSVYILPASNTGTAALIAAVEAALNPKDVRPLNDQVTVDLATAKSYTLNVGYAVYTGQNISAAITQAVNEYKAWQEQTIGRAFNPDRLKAMLYQAGCNRVEFQSGSTFDGGTCEYTEIGEDEYCSGTITLAVIDDD